MQVGDARNGQGNSVPRELDPDQLNPNMPDVACRFPLQSDRQKKKSNKKIKGLGEITITC